MSGIADILVFREVNALRQFVGRHCDTSRIPAGRREIAKPFEQAKRLKYGSVNAYADTVIARFHLAKRGAGGEGAFGHDPGR
jgi:hypothetical protein